MIKIKRTDIIELFDVKKEKWKHNITSIIGIVGEDLGAALFKKYYEKTRKNKVIISKCSVLGVTKNKKAPRLDRWIYIKKSKIAYQTEIKNWSAYAIGGRSIDSDKNIKDIAFENWQERAKSIKKRAMNRENKVLREMKRPNDFPFKKFKPTPLLIYWMVLSEDGKNLKPLFKPKGFKNLYVFSMSNYLRSIKKKGLRLDMPDTKERINLLKRRFVSI